MNFYKKDMTDPASTDSGRPSQAPQQHSQPSQQPASAAGAAASAPPPASQGAGTAAKHAGNSGEPQGEGAAVHPAGSDASTAQLQAELATLKAKSGELADQYLRAKAEAENARRRADDEVAKARKFAVESFAESMLPVLDSLEAGLAIHEATVQQIRDGSQGTLQQLKAALERNKVLPIDPKPGEKFDPNQHHAISVAPFAPGQPAMAPNSVVAVLQKGYTIAERVLRPALVTVSAPS